MSTEQILRIALAHLCESPFNPRLTFTSIDELADNLKAEGRIHQPLLVRPLLGNRYEIVFGHRRYRAAAALGWTDAPCMVREMTDAEARRAQISENLQRADVHPLEEADGLQALIDTEGLSREALAEMTGKSVAWVHARLKLRQACPEVRQACLAGEIGSEVALLLARLRTDKLQHKALAAIKAEPHAKLEDGGQASYRAIKSLLAEKFTLPFKAAIFSTSDAELLPEAGTCLACPKRTGNAPEYADLVEGTTTRWGGHVPGSADICTDPDCWEAKKTAHLAREAARLEAQGKVVVTGNKARAALTAAGDVKGAYVPLEKVKAAIKKAKVQVPVTHIIDQRTGKPVQAVNRTALVEAGLMTAEAAAAATAPNQGRSAQQAQADAEREKAHDKARIESGRRMALLARVRQAYTERERDAFDLRLVAAAALSGVDYNDRPLIAELHGAEDVDALKTAIDTMAVPQLTHLLMDCALVDNVRVQPWNMSAKPAPLLVLAQHYGIDVKAVYASVSGAARDPATMDLFEPADAASTPPAAGASEGSKPARPIGPRNPAGARYFDPETHMSWSGRGLKPAWLKAKLAAGHTLAEFENKPVEAPAEAAEA